METNFKVLKVVNYDDLARNEKVVVLGKGIFSGLLRILFKDGKTDIFINRCFNMLFITKFNITYINEKHQRIYAEIKPYASVINIFDWCGITSYTSPHGMSMVNYSPDLKFSDDFIKNKYYTLYYTFVQTNWLFIKFDPKYFADVRFEVDDEYKIGVFDKLKSEIDKVLKFKQRELIWVTESGYLFGEKSGHAVFLVVDSIDKKITFVNSHGSDDGYTLTFESFIKETYEDYKYDQLYTGMQSEDGLCIFWSKMLMIYFQENKQLLSDPQMLSSLIGACYKPAYPHVYSPLHNKDMPTNIDGNTSYYAVLYEKMFYYYMNSLERDEKETIRYYYNVNREIEYDRSIKGFETDKIWLVDKEVFTHNGIYVNTYMCERHFEIVHHKTTTDVLFFDKEFPDIDHDKVCNIIYPYNNTLDRCYKSNHDEENYKYIFAFTNPIIIMEVNKNPCIIIIKKNIKQIIISGDFDDSIEELNHDIFKGYERIYLNKYITETLKPFQIHYFAMLAMYNDNLDFMFTLFGDWLLKKIPVRKRIFWTHSLAHFYSMYKVIYKK